MSGKLEFMNIQIKPALLSVLRFAIIWRGTCVFLEDSSSERFTIDDIVWILSAVILTFFLLTHFRLPQLGEGNVPCIAPFEAVFFFPLP